MSRGLNELNMHRPNGVTVMCKSELLVPTSFLMVPRQSSLETKRWIKIDKDPQRHSARASVISISRSEYSNVFTNVERAITLVGGMPLSDHNSVVIKINLCGARTPETGAITHPLFLDAILRYLHKNFENLEIYVVESDATTAQPDLFIEWFGFLPILKRWNVTYINLSKQRTFIKKINGRFFREIALPQILEKAFFITLPKLKTSLLTGITCCLKNQFGCLPEVRKVKYHKHIDDVIVDANLATKPDFCIVDAITAMGGELGPGLGTPIPLNAIICGKDPVAVDASCAKLIGFNPRRIGHIRKAAKAGIGSMKYKVVGDEIPKIDFETNKFKMGLFRLGSWLQARTSKS